MSDLTPEDWRGVDLLLAESHVLSAVVLYRELSGCGIVEAKEAIGDRFRRAFPDLWRDYRDVSDND